MYGVEPCRLLASYLLVLNLREMAWVWELRFCFCKRGPIYYTLQEEMVMEAYCFKCRTKREVSNPEAVTLKNGRPATQGTCGVCKTKLFRIGRA